MPASGTDTEDHSEVSVFQRFVSSYGREIQLLTLPLISCKILGKLLNFSETR
jgi:hypothetical protein